MRDPLHNLSAELPAAASLANSQDQVTYLRQRVADLEARLRHETWMAEHTPPTTGSAIPRSASASTSASAYESLIAHLTGSAFTVRIDPKDQSFRFEQLTGPLTTRICADLFNPERWQHALHPNDVARATADLRQLLDGITLDREYQVRDAHANYLHLRVVAIPEWDALKQHVQRVLGAVQDVTHTRRVETSLRHAQRVLERHRQQCTISTDQPSTDLLDDVVRRIQAEKALHQSQQWLQSVLRYAPALVFIKDLEGRYILANERFAESHGLSPQQIIGRTDFDLFPAEVAEALREDDQNVVRQGTPLQFDQYVPDQHGNQRIRVAIKFPLWNEQMQIYAVGGIVTDVTDHRQAEAQLLQMIGYDELTGLPNRTFLVGYLSALKNNLKDRAHILFIDVDNFKLINDSLGHSVGDQLLIGLARCLEQAAPPDALTARFAGDEFLLFLPDMPVADVLSLARTVQQQLAKPIQLADQPVSVGVSIGIATLDSITRTPADLLRNANLALHQAKQRGRGQIVLYDEYLHRQALERWQVATELPQAIPLNELNLYYQPVVSLHNGLVVGFEALLRWLHPRRGLLSPRRFIPIAEESGLIIEVDEWVMQHAIQQTAAWLQADLLHPTFRMRVNVSGRSLLRPDFVDVIANLLAVSKLPPKYLELEITETVAIDYTDHVVAQLAALRAQGITVALDDFGTGYSSLSFLQRVAVDTLKIDASFVRAITQMRESSAIVKSIITLAATLGMEVIAEGIETHNHALLLRGIGCAFGQGFWFSRAVPHTEATAILEQRVLRTAPAL